MLVPAYYSNIAALSGAAGAWTPASLSPDFWVEAGSLSTLFKDTAGTIPVTTDGDAVALWTDKSTAARNVLQTVSGSRPLYKTDLTKPSIKFDGISSLLTLVGSDVAWTDGSGQQWFAIALQSDTTNSREVATIKSSGGIANGDLYVDTKAHLENNGSGGFEEDSTATGTLSANTPVVIIGTVTSTQIEVWVDNVSNGAHTWVGTPSTGLGTMRLSGGGSPWAGRYFAVIHGKGTISSTDRGNLQTYVAALHP